MRTSDSIDLIAPALVAALPKIVPPARTHKGTTPDGDDYFYADLADDLAAAKGPLAAGGIAIMQESIVTDTAVVTVTRLWHSSGQFMESAPLELPHYGLTAAWDIGTLMTYSKRYQLEGMLGMSAQADNDAASVSAKQSKTRPPRRETPAPSPPSQAKASRGTPDKVTNSQLGAIKRRLEKLGWDGDKASAFLSKVAGVDVGEELVWTKDTASNAIDALEREIKKGGQPG